MAAVVAVWEKLICCAESAGLGEQKNPKPTILYGFQHHKGEPPDLFRVSRLPMSN